MTFSKRTSARVTLGQNLLTGAGLQLGNRGSGDNRGQEPTRTSAAPQAPQAAEALRGAPSGPGLAPRPAVQAVREVPADGEADPSRLNAQDTPATSPASEDGPWRVLPERADAAAGAGERTPVSFGLDSCNLTEPRGLGGHRAGPSGWLTRRAPRALPCALALSGRLPR